MKESTDRLIHLYGPPASNEQIKIYFNTLLRTYIELSEKYPSDTLKKLNWYSKRPLKYIFYANCTTVCFTLIGNADKEGAEQVSNVTEMTSNLQNEFSFLTSSTSFNGQKLYSIDSAIKEAISRHKIELSDIELPNIKNSIEDAGKELEKTEPNLTKLRDQYQAICKSFRQLGSPDTGLQANNDLEYLSPFRQSNICPLIDAYVKRLSNLERNYEDIIHSIHIVKDDFQNLKDNTNESIKVLRDNKSYKGKIKANKWVVIGILLSFLIGIVNILYQFFKK